jgi:hypothetical protein
MPFSPRDLPIPKKTVPNQLKKYCELIERRLKPRL